MERGTLTAEALTAACLDRARVRDDEVRAWSWRDEDVAMAAARYSDQARRRGNPLGPLHGLPIGVKDVMLTRDMPTAYNSPIHADFRPNIDAACVAVLRQAGAIVLGKTHTVEFGAIGSPPPTRNPHDLARTPGGSSSGSAAAVADFQVPLALGTQTGGSIVRPASYCGVWGFKPTWGLVGAEGCKAFAPSLDTVGWFARDIDDLGLILNVFDPVAAPEMKPSLHVAVFPAAAWDEVDDAARAVLARAANALEAAGCCVSPFPAPQGFDDLPATHRAIMRGEGRAAFLAQHLMDPERLHADIDALVTAPVTAAELCQAYNRAGPLRIAFDATAARFDAILAPSAVGEAPAGLESTGGYGLNGGWTLLHGPVVNAPFGSGGHGLPIGVTLAGARFADRRILAVARLLAHATRTPEADM